MKEGWLVHWEVRSLKNSRARLRNKGYNKVISVFESTLFTMLTLLNIWLKTQFSIQSILINTPKPQYNQYKFHHNSMNTILTLRLVLVHDYQGKRQWINNLLRTLDTKLKLIHTKFSKKKSKLLKTQKFQYDYLKSFWWKISLQSYHQSGLGDKSDYWWLKVITNLQDILLTLDSKRCKGWASHPHLMWTLNLVENMMFVLDSNSFLLLQDVINKVRSATALKCNI